jgi:hypothetical protein
MASRGGNASAESDMSLCAPFLAFDPVMQLVVGQLFMPVLCPLIGLGCDEVGAAYPWHHIAALGSVVAGAFFLSIGARQDPSRRCVFSSPHRLVPQDENNAISDGSRERTNGLTR